MVSRQNLDGRSGPQGVLGRVLNPVARGARRSGPKISPPEELANQVVPGETPPGPQGRRGAARVTAEQSRSLPAAENAVDPTANPAAPVNPARNRQAGRRGRTPEMSVGLIDPNKVGIQESLGDAFVPPTQSAKQPINQPPPARPRPGGLANMVRQGMDQQRAAEEADRAARYPTTSPGIGETAYRPGYTPPTNYISEAESQANARRLEAENTGGTRSEIDVTSPTLRSPRSRSRRNIR